VDARPPGGGGGRNADAAGRRRRCRCRCAAGGAAQQRHPRRPRGAALFARYDKDKDASVSRDEYLITRKKAFARLDLNGDGRLGFDEYAAATTRKFGKADRDGDGALAAAAKRKDKPACVCAKTAEPE
jgi:hypothetical protein